MKRTDSTLTLSSFLALGFVVGTLTGFSNSPVAATVLASLFAFIGPAAAIFAVSKGERTWVQVALLSLSLGCLGGVYSSVYVNERQLLTPGHLRQQASSDSMNQSREKYLRSNLIEEADKIDQLRANGLSDKDAYDKLYKAVIAARASE